MLRTSSYTIYVDLPDRRDEMLLVHGYTGAYDRVSRRVADYLRSLEARRAPKPLYGEWGDERPRTEEAEPPSPSVIEVLEKRGYLTRLSPADEEKLFTRLSLRLHERASRRLPSYIFMPTYDCNLRCPYCFQDHMRTDPSFRRLLTTMRPEMVDRIFRALPQVEEGHGVDPAVAGKRSIGFFGGEPLLARHRPIVEHIMARARESGGAHFWAVTNATEIDAYHDLLGPDGLARLQVTLDGPPDEHDQRRVYPDGSGSFARIARHVTLALDLGVEVSIRFNVDRDNIGDLPRLAAELHDQGWTEHRNFSAYTAPINAINDQTDRGTTMDSWELDQALTELREEHPQVKAIGRPDETIRGRARQIFEGEEELMPRFKPSFCGAHDQMYIFDPFGDVYACWERTGDAKIRIGHVNDQGELELAFEQNRLWRGRSVASNPACRRCRYALHCGGGCAILALGRRGKFNANYCDGFASRFRASVAEAYLSHLAGERIHGQYERVCDL